MLLRHIPIVSFGFNGLKIAILKLMTRKGLVHQKKFDNNELQELFDENLAPSLKELSENLAVDESTVLRRLHAMGKIQKEEKWLPHELSESAISNRFNIAISLFARQKRKSFLWPIVTGDEK